LCCMSVTLALAVHMFLCKSDMLIQIEAHTLPMPGLRPRAEHRPDACPQSR
jgi:hypothetical protein